MQTSQQVRSPYVTGGLHAYAIDDQATMLRIVSNLLREIGIKEIECFQDAKLAREALTASSLRTPDLIVCDLHMDGTDGMQFLTGLRRSKLERLKQIPVLILTADNDEFLLDVVRQAGAALVVNKPVSVGGFRDAVETVLGYQLQRQG